MEATKQMQQQEPRDWGAVMDRLIDGDAMAFHQASDLVCRFLHGWRAYYLRNDWEDLAQEVLITVARDVESQRIREKRAMAGYIRTVARRRLVDTLRRRRPELVALDPDALVDPAPHAACDGFGLEEHVRRLPQRQRAAVEAVYVEGLTQEEASERSGVPLGSLKRHLREGLATLRTAMGVRLN